MFHACDDAGFHITFANGFGLSVQWGGGTYSDNHSLPRPVPYELALVRSHSTPASTTAEIAVIGPDGKLVPLSNGDGVQGYTSADEVALLMTHVAALPAHAGFSKEHRLTLPTWPPVTTR